MPIFNIQSEHIANTFTLAIARKNILFTGAPMSVMLVLYATALTPIVRAGSLELSAGLVVIKKAPSLTVSETNVRRGKPDW